MKIPQGYKQTELGIIPEDWHLKRLGGLSHIKTGKRNGDEQIKNGRYPFFVRSNCIARIDSYSFDGEAILIPGEGGIGNIFHYINGKFDYHQRVYKISNFVNDLNGKFLYYYLQKYFGIYALSLTVKATVDSLRLPTFKEFIISIPISVEEQQRIATALSDVDALIAALDKKIAKKCLIKQGAMQQLLTGKKRLAGFSAPWVEKKIYEIGKLTGSGVDKKNIVGEKSIRLVNFLDVFREDRIYNKNLHFWTTASDNKIKTCNVLQGDVFFTPSSEMPYDIALSAVAMESMDSVCHSYHIYRLRFIEDVDLLYRAYMFKSNSFYEQANVACEGSGKRYVISLSKFNNLTVYYPSNKHEQRAIATILSVMDKEIADLEARRDKYKLIKSGMMQKLLTGQIRLIKPQAKAIPLAPQMPATKEIPVDAHIVAGHIVYKSHQSRGWGRTKLQKSLHLIGYIMQLNLGNEYIRNTAGPDDQRMMNYIDQKFKQFRHVNIIKEKLQDGRTHYSYIPTALIQDIEIAYERYPQDVREQIDALLDKLNTMDLAGAEILSTLYAVWNNRIIKGEQITDDLLISDFYAWSEHKAEFEEARVRKALDDIRIQNIIPTGWGQYIDKK